MDKRTESCETCVDKRFHILLWRDCAARESYISIWVQEWSAETELTKYEVLSRCSPLISRAS
jgi:hypothetical protein